MFNERKTAQMAAFFISHEGGEISKLKLMKLLYLAERESLRQHGRVMTGDYIVAMPHGLVLSKTLNLANEDPFVEDTGDWCFVIERKDNRTLALRSQLAEKDADELSQSDQGILNDIFGRFGHMAPEELSKYTHKLPEWNDPRGTSIPVSHREILTALGEYNEEEINAVCEQIEIEENIDQAFR